MTFWKWSQTAANNATADSTCPFPEGMSGAALNDGTRGMMAAAAKYRDDIAGAIVTNGTSSAYAVSSFQVFDSFAHLNGQTIAFTPHVTNAGSCTLNADSLGVKPLRSAPNTELPAGTIIQGTPYLAVYNNTDGAFYLHGFYGNAYNIPLGASVEFWLPTAPNSSFVFPYGQAISRTTYASLFTAMGTTFGSGDGSTTFNIPDLRGRVTASPDNMGGSDAGRLTGSTVLSSRTTLGGVGGESAHTQTVNEMPAHNHGANVIDPGHSHSYNAVFGTEQKPTSGGDAAYVNTIVGTTSASTTGISVSINNNGGGAAFNVIQPTILCNRILRVI